MQKRWMDAAAAVEMRNAGLLVGAALPTADDDTDDCCSTTCQLSIDILIITCEPY